MTTDSASLRPLMRCLVRLLGVYLVITGGSSSIGYGIDFATRVDGLLPSEYLQVAGDAIGWFLAGLFQVFAGLYLIIDGQMAMDAIFRERRDPDAPDESDPPAAD